MVLDWVLYTSSRTVIDRGMTTIPGTSLSVPTIEYADNPRLLENSRWLQYVGVRYDEDQAQPYILDPDASVIQSGATIITV